MSDTFYTNIELRGNNILYHGYENGIPVRKKIPYRPHLFVNDSKGEYKSFTTKQPLRRQEFDSIKELKTFVDTYSDVSNFKIFGCSDMIRQFTANQFSGEIKWDYEKTKIWFFDIETRVEGLDMDHDATVDAKVKDKEVSLSYKRAMMLLDADIPYDVLVDGEWYPIRQSPLYVAGFPKPELAQQEILLLSMIDHHSGVIRLWANRAIESDNDTFALDIQNRLLKIKDTALMTGDTPVMEYAIDVRQYDMDEPAMLKDFLTFWSSQRIDVISGWNSEGFDVPYLVNRLKNVLGDQPTSLLSPWGDVKERRYRDDNGNECQTYDIYGITHLDYLVLYKKFNPGAKESFKLDFIANLELGHGKLPMKGNSFRENYLSYWNEFILYNLVDTYLLHQLEENLLQVRLAMQVAYMAKCNFGDVVSAMRVWESFIYNHFLGLSIAEDWKKPSNKKQSIVGAYVKDVVPGKYGWTVSIDATSMYPSIIIQNNISPENIVGHAPVFVDDFIAGHSYQNHVNQGEVISGNGLLTSMEDEGFMPYLINRMFELRKKTKNQMLDLKKKRQGIKERLKELGVTV